MPTGASHARKWSDLRLLIQKVKNRLRNVVLLQVDVTEGTVE